MLVVITTFFSQPILNSLCPLQSISHGHDPSFGGIFLKHTIYIYIYIYTQSSNKETWMLKSKITGTDISFSPSLWAPACVCGFSLVFDLPQLLSIFPWALFALWTSSFSMQSPRDCLTSSCNHDCMRSNLFDKCATISTSGSAYPDCYI